MSATNKNRLGKGLDALIPTEIDEFAPQSMPSELKVDKNSVIDVNVSDIKPNPYQPRHEFTEEALNELAESIKVHGVIQPLIVTKAGTNYQLIAGERRWRASQKAGLVSVPVIVRSYDKQEQLEVALIENVQRSDLRPLELATAYQKLTDQFNLTHRDIAARVGKSSPYVANTIRLLGLPHDAKVALNKDLITYGHARGLLAIRDPAQQAELLAMIIEKGLTVREVEEMGRNFAREGGIKNKRVIEKEQYGSELTTNLGRYLGTKVNIYKTSKGGKLQIEFYSDEELDRLYSQIMPQ